MHGVRIGSRLTLFYQRVQSAQTSPPFDFEAAGWKAVAVDNPDADPSEWAPIDVAGSSRAGDIQVGHAVLRIGETLYIYGIEGESHSIDVARISVADFEAGAWANLAWWDGARYGGAPAHVVGIGAPEFSVHHQPDLDRYVMVSSSGFGATTLAIRTASAPEGPWSEPEDVFRPPESFGPDPFVYAGKGHPELRGPADLVATYVPSRFGDVSAEDAGGLYYPHFVRISFR